MKPLRKEFTMSIADLCMLASNLVIFMERDATEFSTRGVDAADTTAFEALGNAFEVFPTDEYYVGMIKGATSAKNAARENATALIQLISGFFDQEYGTDSEQYTQLRVKGIANFSDSNFLVTCRAVVSVATEYLSTLSAIGLTQTNIDDLEDEAQLMEDNMNLMASKRALRDSKARERTLKGNELYSFCTKYAKIGKLIWENVDESFYNDYVIYPTVHSGLSKPQNLAAEYVAATPPVIHMDWDEVSDATAYKLFVSIRDIGAPSGEFNLLDTFSVNFADVPAVVNKRNYFKLKAINSTNTSDYSSEVFVDAPVA